MILYGILPLSNTVLHIRIMLLQLLCMFLWVQTYRPSKWSCLPSVKALSNRSTDWGRWRRKSGHIPPPPEWWKTTWNHGTWRNKLITYHVQRMEGHAPWGFRREVSNLRVTHTLSRGSIRKVLKIPQTPAPLCLEIGFFHMIVIKTLKPSFLSPPPQAHF